EIHELSPPRCGGWRTRSGSRRRARAAGRRRPAPLPARRSGAGDKASSLESRTGGGGEGRMFPGRGPMSPPRNAMSRQHPGPEGPVREHRRGARRWLEIRQTRRTTMADAPPLDLNDATPEDLSGRTSLGETEIRALTEARPFADWTDLKR